MAPELRVALAKRQPAIPTVATDLFSLAVLVHEIILLVHPSAGNDGDELHFQEAMCSGKWLLDPAVAGPSSRDLGGYPATVLSTDLARLFRSAMSLDPGSRPSAESWEAELSAAFHAVDTCPYPGCGSPFIIDVSQVACPLCGRPFPHLTLRMKGHGGGIPLVDGATILGRTELGNSPQVSARHAIFRRMGTETWIESIGRNGTCRWNGSRWVRLPDGKAVLVQAGDRLLLGDVEILLDWGSSAIMDKTVLDILGFFVVPGTSIMVLIPLAHSARHAADDVSGVSGYPPAHGRLGRLDSGVKVL
jgi:hypothetical protein